MSQDSEELDQISEANLSGEAGSQAMEYALHSSFVILKLELVKILRSSCCNGSP